MSSIPLQHVNARREDTLPHELIVSIQRVLNLHPGPDADPLGDLSDNFSPVGILNEFFPDGVFLSSKPLLYNAECDCIQRRP